MKLRPIATEPRRRGDAVSLTPEDAERHFREHRLGCGDAPRRVGVEVEWLVHDMAAPQSPVPFETLTAAVEAAGTMPGGSRVTFEPGGQLELSGPPRSGPAAACAAVAADLDVLRPALAGRGLAVAGIGLDPSRPPRRVVDSPRYRAMEAYFDVQGRAGRQMMCSTAAIQVNVDAGPEPAATWRVAHAVGAVLAATFANSPVLSGTSTGWRSTRLTTWWAIDPSRTRPVGGADPDAAWADYALGARVMLLPSQDFTPVTEPLTFAEWMASGYRGTRPSASDLEYHLTTLFPPVRPRRWLELRMIDGLPGPYWKVPVAIAATLLEPDLAEAVTARVSPADGWWRTAARYGLSNPVLARAAKRCFDLAEEVLAGGPDADLLGVVRAYRHRWVDRARCPADDVLAAWNRNAHYPQEDEFACTT
jgi:glutamate--cysteine ligase